MDSSDWPFNDMNNLENSEPPIAARLRDYLAPTWQRSEGELATFVTSRTPASAAVLSPKELYSGPHRIPGYVSRKRN